MPVVNDYTALLSGSYWGGIEVTNTPVIVTYSFPTSLPAYDESIPGFTPATDASFTAFTAAEQAQAVQALGEWAAASGLVFIQVAPGQGDINFVNVDFSTTSNPSYAGAGGIGFYPFGDWNYFSYPNFQGDLDAAGDVFMNSQFLVNDVVNYGTLLHEIGHAIGLKHPTEVVTDYAANPPVVHDQVLASDDPTQTVMATVGDSSDGSDTHLQALDRDAAAAIYGPAGTGGVYTVSASGANSVSTWTWDATTETLTQHAVSVGETIRGTSVNDIIYGSTGDDRLFGLAGDNVLYGKAGNDSLFGGTGTNRLIGGPGDDSYYVSSKTTRVVEKPNQGYDAVYSTVSFKMPNNVEELHLFGAGLTGTANAQGGAIYADGSLGSTLVGGAGIDYLVGGTGDDTFRFSVANLSNGDQVFGDAGHDTLTMTTAGVVNAAGVSGVETIRLAKSGANTLTLTDANFANVDGSSIKVLGGNAGDTIDASSVTGSNRLVFVGGAGNDTILAGSDAVLTGGGGNNQFTFADVGASRITDFGSSAGNMLVLRDSGFNLGVDEGLGTGTPQHLDASVFVANATGKFTDPGQRFAYNTTNGMLYYDPDGNGSGSGKSAIVKLTDHYADLAAGASGQIFFIA